MKNGLEYSEGVAVGAVLGVIVSVVFLAIALHVGEQEVNVAAEMFATIAALCGAWLALHGIRRQIQSSIDLQDMTARKKLEAARSVLPLALAHVADVARNNLRGFFNEEDLYDRHSSQDFSYIDNSFILVLKDCIELAPENVASRLSKIISSYQILSSRGHGRNYTKIKENHGDWESGELNTILDAISWAGLYALTSSLFVFARGINGHELKPLSKSDVGSAFLNCGVNTETFPKLAELLESRALQGKLEINFEKYFDQKRDNIL